MHEYCVVITQPAERDLLDIDYYITVNFMAPDTAVNIITLIRDEVLKLSYHPLKHPLVQDSFLAQYGYRLLVVKSYNIFYTINDGESIVYIERILSDRRDWVNIL
ncbi:hypothetical protein AGMMS49992_32890 [Clostridia bacterium]|nr:hypothetical protein AGMMS49992_32890 [Clostridia bacterium]